MVAFLAILSSEMEPDAVMLPTFLPSIVALMLNVSVSCAVLVPSASCDTLWTVVPRMTEPPFWLMLPEVYPCETPPTEHVFVREAMLSEYAEPMTSVCLPVTSE